MSHYSLWLLPAADQEAELVRAMGGLRLVLGGEAFGPHLTVQGDLAQPLETLLQALPQMAATVPVQRWRIRQVEMSEHFFRSLYLRFDDEPAFAALQAAMQELSGTGQGLSPYPHVSLSYGPAHAGKAALREQLAGDWVGRVLTLDRLAVTNSAQSVAIGDWRVLAVQALGGAKA